MAASTGCFSQEASVFYPAAYTCMQCDTVNGLTSSAILKLTFDKKAWTVVMNFDEALFHSNLWRKLILNFLERIRHILFSCLSNLAGPTTKCFL